MNWLIPFAAAYLTLLLRKLVDKEDHRLHWLLKRRPLSCDVCMSAWGTLAFLYDMRPETVVEVFTTCCLTYITIRALNKLTGWTNRLIDMKPGDKALEDLLPGGIPWDEKNNHSAT